MVYKNSLTHDEKEAGWLIQRNEQVFVVLIFCRFLYFVVEQKIASKKRSSFWALGKFENKWHKLINDALFFLIGS